MGVYRGVAQDNVTITSGNATLNTLTVTGLSRSSGAFSVTAPVIKTADFAVGDTETFLINNKTATACSVTLPAAASWPGRILVIKTIQALAVNSASSNVIPIGTNTPGTAIVAGVAGNWALLVSNGTNWVIMAT